MRLLAHIHMSEVALGHAGAEPDLAEVGHGHHRGIHIIPVAALRARHLHHAPADRRLDHIAAARAGLHIGTQLGQAIGRRARIGAGCGQGLLRGLIVLARRDLGIEQQLLAVELLARQQQRGLGFGIVGPGTRDIGGVHGDQGLAGLDRVAQLPVQTHQPARDRRRDLDHLFRLGLDIGRRRDQGLDLLLGDLGELQLRQHRRLRRHHDQIAFAVQRSPAIGSGGRRLFVAVAGSERQTQQQAGRPHGTAGVQDWFHKQQTVASIWPGQVPARD